MYKFLLSNRYLRTRFIALASIISVTLGVATMIVVNSVMSGFSTQMRERIHGILADVVIRTRSMDGETDPDEAMARAMGAAGPFIEAMTPVVEVPAMMTFEFLDQQMSQPVTLIGIDPEGKNAVSPLAEFLLHHQSETPDQELDWELSDEALDVRQRWIEWRQLMAQSYTGSGPGAFEQVAGQQRQPIRTAQADIDPPPTSGSPHDPIDHAPADQPATLTNNATPIESPFMGDTEALPSDLFGDSYAVAADDPYAPFSARVYVGCGLIGFPSMDPETEETTIRYMTQPGKDVSISTIKTGNPEPASFNATIVDIFKSGMTEYDANFVFCNLRELQKVRGMLDPQTDQGAFTAIHIKLKDDRRAQEVIGRLRAEFPPGQFQVRTWEEMQGPLLEAVRVESAILNVLLFLIIAVAGFGILAIFYMIVVEKTKDIGILKSLGASSSGVMSIFLSYGLSLGIVGAGAGTVLGLLFVHYINEIEAGVSLLSGHKVFDPNIYYFHEIPTSVSPMMVLWVAFGAVLIAVMASVLPARRAARLHPVEALRYE